MIVLEAIVTGSNPVFLTLGIMRVWCLTVSTRHCQCLGESSNLSTRSTRMLSAKLKFLLEKKKRHSVFGDIV